MKNDVLYGWESEQTKELFQAILKLKNLKECEDFFRDLMTLHEIEEMANRFQIAKMIDRGLSYLEIADKAQVSTTTVTRVGHWLHHGRGGYRLVIDRMRK